MCMKLEKQLDSISQSAMVMYNDCVYLAQEILGLSFEVHATFFMIYATYILYILRILMYGLFNWLSEALHLVDHNLTRVSK